MGLVSLKKGAGLALSGVVVRAGIGSTITLAEFVRQSWQVLEPTTQLDWNWHVDAICLHVQETLLDWLKHKQDPSHEQRIRNLLINVPPGSLKSRIVSVCTPAWFWLYDPSWRAIFLSANPRVALRDSVFCRDLIESDWYQNTFKPWWKLRADNNAKSSFWNSAGGFRNAGGMDSRITGDRGDALFVDDPHDADEVKSEVKREHVKERWDSAISNRVNDLRSSVRIGIMQRLDELDWAAHVKQQGWAVLCIRQEFEPGLEPTPIGWEDPRTLPGELMMPSRFTAEILGAEKRRLTASGYAAQHQQNPSPSGGGMFKIRNWRLALNLPPIMRTILSVDAAFKCSKTSDYVVIGSIAQTEPVRTTVKLGPVGSDGKPTIKKIPEYQYWIPELWRGKAGITDTEAQLQSMIGKYPQAHTKLIEDKANGPAIIERMRGVFSGIEPYQPGSNSKESRASAMAPVQERGDILLPCNEQVRAYLKERRMDSITIGEWWDLHPPEHESNAEHVPAPQWVKVFIDELAAFPTGAHDDQVDMLSQGVNWSEANKPPTPYKEIRAVW